MTYASPCPSDPYTAAQATDDDTVYYWNQKLREAFALQGGAPAPLALAAAMMNVGIYDVMNSVYFAKLEALSTGTPTTEICGWDKYLVLADTPATTNADLAAGIAALAILIAALPGQTTFIQGAYNDRYGTTSQTAATALGTYVANVVKAARLDDGSDDATHISAGLLDARCHGVSRRTLLQARRALHRTGGT